MRIDAPTARQVFDKPHERHVLDYHDGVVQAVYLHDTHGAWYVFALVPGGQREQWFCLRPLADASVVAAVKSAETVDELDWLVRFGRETLIPACAPLAFRVRRLDGVILDVTQMTDEARDQALPISPAELAERGGS